MLLHFASPISETAFARLRDYRRKLLLSADEFMRLLEDCYSGRANDSSWPSGSSIWK
jgi:hypothetical protein